MKEQLINEIIFVCKALNISDNKQIPLDTVWMNLIGLSVSELTKVAQELNIKIPNN